MHASIWSFAGDPDELLRAYDAMVTQIPPDVMKLHLCLRAADGIVNRPPMANMRIRPNADCPKDELHQLVTPDAGLSLRAEAEVARGEQSRGLLPDSTALLVFASCEACGLVDRRSS